MLLTRLPDGSLLCEVRGDHFTREWKAATPSQRIVLDDKRPAVRKATDLGVTLITVHPKAWDVIKYLKRHDKLTTAKGRLCEACHSEMKVVAEREGYWTFHCPNCKSISIDDKRLIGGSIRSGEKEPT